MGIVCITNVGGRQPIWRVLMSALRRVLWLVCLIIVLISCDKPAAHKAMALAGLNRLHSNIEHGRYHDIYSEASTELRQSVTESQLTSLFQAVNDSLGPAKTTSLRRYMAKLDASGFTIFAEFDTEFQKGPAMEQSAWRISRGHAVLSAYEINSPHLAMYQVTKPR